MVPGRFRVPEDARPVRNVAALKSHSSSLIFIRSESEESIEIYVYLGDDTSQFNYLKSFIILFNLL